MFLYSPRITLCAGQAKDDTTLTGEDELVADWLEARAMHKGQKTRFAEASTSASRSSEDSNAVGNVRH